MFSSLRPASSKPFSDSTATQMAVCHMGTDPTVYRIFFFFFFRRSVFSVFKIPTGSLIYHFKHSISRDYPPGRCCYELTTPWLPLVSVAFRSSGWRSLTFLPLVATRFGVRHIGNYATVTEACLRSRPNIPTPHLRPAPRVGITRRILGGCGYSEVRKAWDSPSLHRFVLEEMEVPAEGCPPGVPPPTSLSRTSSHAVSHPDGGFVSSPRPT